MSTKSQVLRDLRRALRPHKGSYPRIAKRVGISYTALSHIAAGQYPHCPHFTTVVRIYRELGRTVLA